MPFGTIFTIWRFWEEGNMTCYVTWRLDFNDLLGPSWVWLVTLTNDCRKQVVHLHSLVKRLTRVEHNLLTKRPNSFTANDWISALLFNYSWKSMVTTILLFQESVMASGIKPLALILRLHCLRILGLTFLQWSASPIKKWTSKIFSC